MPWERAILLFINRHSSSFLDRVFVLSNDLGTLPFCAAVVVAVAGWHLRRHEKRPAALWVILGLSTYALQVGIKALVDRSRPDLWEHLVLTNSSSFPSGHALAAATFYPLLAWSLSHFHPPLKRLWWTIGLGLGFYVGFGRMYLGVHWPSDVMAGWAIGAGQTMAGLAALARRERGPDAVVHAE
jgi:membrane-associated phospholipid phosphatase